MKKIIPIKVLSVFGTRPEAIKMAPLIKELEKDVAFESFVCVTGQHREMLDSVLSVFDITPHWDLHIMRENQSLAYITTAVIEKLSEVLIQCKPDLILVHGDTSTSFGAALAGFYQKIPIAHVEAGLRSFHQYSPFPEELNRTLISHIASLHFAPTEENRHNLLQEQITQGIFVTGNTVIDAMSYTIQEDYHFEEPLLNTLNLTDYRTILVTAHRRENLGEPLETICNAILNIVETFPDIQVVFPVHKNPVVRTLVSQKLGNIPRIYLTEPISVLDMHNLISRSCLVLTDSGGLQEEAPALHKPVLVLRRETERPEVIESGGAILVGTEEEPIISVTARLLQDPFFYQAMQSAINPYGDGTASVKITGHIKAWIKDRR